MSTSPAYERQVVGFLGAIGDPTRIPILFLLGERGPLNVGEIAAQFALSRPTISHHLKLLYQANIISREQRGQEVYYTLNCDDVVAQLRELADLIDVCGKRA